jgi:putative YpdA family bacillithiol system oxidoreductase
MGLDTIITVGATLLLFSVTVVPYYLRTRRNEARAQKKYKQLQVTGMHAALTMHPHIDVLKCIGCGGCVGACPEHDVLAVIKGKSTLVHGANCVGHGLCADACPVGAITLVMAAPSRSAQLPVLSERFETSMPNTFIVGELGGMGLIKNAISQGKVAVEEIARRPRTARGSLDVLIVGAGPAGLGAALMAKKLGLRYALIEQNDIGGTILQYPRRKIVMTSPVEIPLYGTLKLRETSKESLLAIWQDILAKTQLHVNANEKVQKIQQLEGMYHVVTSKETYVAAHVVLALGRRGTPRRLGVPGENLGKVTYRLIDAESYKNCDALIVGGGDSAVEAAIALALQGTNRVTLSYRKEEFSRLKSRNAERLADYINRKKITAILQSEVIEIKEHEVTLETSHGPLRLKNNYVFVCIGGELPFEFLQEIGIKFHSQIVPENSANSAAA